MDHIHTTAATVSRLKKRAKLHAQRAGVKHADALDAVAREDKYLDWRHVLACAESSGVHNVCLRPTVEAAYGSRYWRSPSGSITVVVGRSGTGKTFLAHHLLLDAVAGEHACCVIDCGGSYENVAKLVGGTCIYLTPDGQHDAKKYGHARLLVIDVERLLHHKPWGRQLEDLLTEYEFGAVTAGLHSVLLVDELDAVHNHFADLPTVVTRLLAGGAQAVVLSQDSLEAERLKPYLNIPASQRAIELTARRHQGQPRADLSVEATELTASGDEIPRRYQRGLMTIGPGAADQAAGTT